jgi:hypothetical protein
VEVSVQIFLPSGFKNSEVYFRKLVAFKCVLMVLPNKSIQLIYFKEMHIFKYITN